MWREAPAYNNNTTHTQEHNRDKASTEVVLKCNTKQQCGLNATRYREETKRKAARFFFFSFLFCKYAAAGSFHANRPSGVILPQKQTSEFSLT